MELLQWKTGLAAVAMVVGAGMVAAQEARPSAAAEGAAKPKRDVHYVLIHAPGPRWDHSKGMFEQAGLQVHIAHYRKLLAEGKLLLGGPFMDGKSGGMMLPGAGLDEKELTDFAMEDPAVKDGLLTVQVRPWLIGMRK